MMSPTLEQQIVSLLCGRYSPEYLVTVCITIRKLRDCCQRNKKGTEENQGAKGPIADP